MLFESWSALTKLGYEWISIIHLLHDLSIFVGSWWPYTHDISDLTDSSWICRSMSGVADEASPQMPLSATHLVLLNKSQHWYFVEVVAVPWIISPISLVYTSLACLCCLVHEISICQKVCNYKLLPCFKLNVRARMSELCFIVNIVLKPVKGDKSYTY